MRKARFAHLHGPFVGEADVLPRADPTREYFVGRDPGSVVRVDPQDMGVSRRHVRLGWTSDGHLWVEDAGSSNGTTVDGASLRGRRVLRPGSVLGMGPTMAVRLEWVPTGPPVDIGDEPAAPRSVYPRVRLLAGVAGGGAVALALAGIVLLLVLTRRDEEANAALERSIEELARAMEDRSTAGTDGLGKAVDEVRARAARAPPLPSTDPLATHIERVLYEMSAGESKTVIRVFRDLVARKLAPMLRRAGNHREPTYCRAARVRPVLIRTLEEQLRSTGDRLERAKWIAYIPWVETGYRQDMVGLAGEVGMWQFMRGTAMDVGMSVAPTDERCDLDTATRGAARLFTLNFRECGAEFPLLAVAAYNTGAHNACRVARNADIPKEQRDFLGFIKYELLPYGQTREYIPEWLAASFIGEQPAAALQIAREYDPDVPDYVACREVDERPLGGPCRLADAAADGKGRPL